MGICISACTTTHLEPLDAMDTFSTSPDGIHQAIDDDVEEMIIVALGRQYTAVGTVGSGVDAPMPRHRAPSSTGESTGNQSAVMRDEEEATNPLHVSSRERELHVNFGLDGHGLSSASSERCLEDGSLSSARQGGGDAGGAQPPGNAQHHNDSLHSTDSIPVLPPCSLSCAEDKAADCASIHSSQCSGGVAEANAPHPCVQIHNDEPIRFGPVGVQPFSEALFHVVHCSQEEPPPASGTATSSSSRKNSSNKGSRSSSASGALPVPPPSTIDPRQTKGSCGGISPLMALFSPSANHRNSSRVHNGSNAAQSGNSDPHGGILIEKEENFAEVMLPTEYTNSNNHTLQSSNLFAPHQSDRSQGGSSLTSMDPSAAPTDAAAVVSTTKDGDTVSKYSALGRSRRDTVQSLLSKSSTGSVADAMLMMEPSTPRLLETPKDAPVSGGAGEAHISPFHFRETELETMPVCDQPSVGNVKFENVRLQRPSLELCSVVRIQSANNKSSSNRSPCCDED